jgi:hypothetical protein
MTPATAPARPRSERQGPKGVAGEYEYLADPVHAAVRAKGGEATKAPPVRGRAGTGVSGVGG